MMIGAKRTTTAATPHSTVQRHVFVFTCHMVRDSILRDVIGLKSFQFFDYQLLIGR